MDQDQRQLPSFSVSEFIAVTNQTLDMAYPAVVIEGEVDSFKVNQGKYVFFNLKDNESSVGCFMMLFQMRTPLQDGMKVVVRARPKLTKWGKFSLTIDAVRPVGEGSLKKSFELLKAKLDKEGLFSPERKRLLPESINKVGLIASTESAGYADFTTIAAQRWGGIEFQVYHVQVQGESSPDKIIKAIEYFNTREELVDCLVLIRGGGSLDDLASFNDEAVVRAIAASRIPTVVGVGHETDTTLSDLAADVRAATPSNAAEIITPDKADVKRYVEGLVTGVPRRIQLVLDTKVLNVAGLIDRLDRTIDLKIESYQDAVKGSVQLLESYNPANVLRRGYSIIRGTPAVGSDIQIETNEAIIKAEVKSYERK